jgi:D-methionine transport system substrate-binding protein
LVTAACSQTSERSLQSALAAGNYYLFINNIKGFNMKKLLFLLLCVSLFVFTSCDSAQDKNTAADKKKIKIGCTEPSFPLLEKTAEYMTTQGFETELVLIEGNVNVIRSVNDHSVDAGLGVHKAFMEKFSNDNKGDLVMVKPYAFYVGIGLYSDRYKSIADFPVGAKIAIMNDAMNMSRGLKMMEDEGCNKLDKNKNSGYTTLDIVENPKKFEFIDMDQTQTVRALQDLDAAIVFFTHMRNAQRDCRAYLALDAASADFPMGFVVNLPNENAPWAKALATGLRTAEMRKFVEDKYQGVFIFFD